MTERQRQLLAAIIQEFIETANAVGSVSLNDKYSFNVSPATIRNEMAALVNEGYLAKPHSSSGRVPTTLGLRYFLEEILDAPKEVDVVTKEKIKNELHTHRFDKEAMIRRALKYLSAQSRNAAIALVGRDIYYSGLADMLDIPEFQEIDSLRRVMLLLEDYSALSEIFNRSKSDDEVKVLIGDETGLDTFQNYAVIFSELRLHKAQKGYIAIIGPNRMNYRQLMPAVGFIARGISNAAKGW